MVGNKENRRQLIITIHPPTHPDTHLSNRTIMVFSRFFSIDQQLKIETANFLFANHILNWKDSQVDPLGFAFVVSLREIKVHGTLHYFVKVVWFKSAFIGILQNMSQFEISFSILFTLCLPSEGTPKTIPVSQVFPIFFFFRNAGSRRNILVQKYPVRLSENLEIPYPPK